MFLGRHLWCHFSSLIEGRTHQFKFRMLILHRGSHILVPHRLHHRCQIPGLRQYPCTVIMPAAIQDQLLGKTRLRTRCAKLSSHIRQMAALRSLGWKQPSFASSIRSSAQHLAHTIAHAGEVQLPANDSCAARAEPQRPRKTIRGRFFGGHRGPSGRRSL